MAEPFSGSGRLRCGPLDADVVVFLREADSVAIRSFVADEDNASQPGFDSSLACHLTQASPIRSAGVLRLLGGNKKRLETVRSVLRAHLPPARWRLMEGASKAQVLYSSTASDRLRNIPSDFLAQEILLQSGQSDGSLWRSIHGGTSLRVYHQEAPHLVAVRGAAGVFGNPAGLWFMVSDPFGDLSWMTPLLEFGERVQRAGCATILPPEAIEEALDETLDFGECIDSCGGDRSCEIDFCYEGQAGVE